MASYCEFAPTDPLHRPYHDEEYGFPVSDDSTLFERLVLEINQAGLSWLTILMKRQAFRDAFDGFVIDEVARYGARKRAKLLENAGIIRNRLKVDAAIENAKRIRALRETHGSFRNWIDAHHPRTKTEWVKLFRKTFVFTGGEITGEFLMSTGYLPGAHEESCPVYARVIAARPAWLIASA
jgi:DNA-3-methyladenine glycosylase I